MVIIIGCKIQNLQNWISNHRQQIARDSGIGAGRTKVKKRQTSGRDVYFEQMLPGTLIQYYFLLWLHI